jgi:hypothetical protein
MNMGLNKKSIPCGGLVGKTFGRLTVLREYSNKKYILCECSCSCGGNTTSTRREGLLNGRTQSCGCIRKEIVNAKNRERFDPNAVSKSVEYRILTRAKSRAKQNNIPFNLELIDIVIPETCPLLGIPIEIQPKKGYHPNSPSLDKIIPEKGYIKGNVWVISNRANTLKNDASLQELQTLVENLKCSHYSQHS